jgi:hypothetical protein
MRFFNIIPQILQKVKFLRALIKEKRAELTALFLSFFKQLAGCSLT